MTPASRWTAAALLPLISLFEALSWFGARSVLGPHLIDLGAEPADVASLLAASLGIGLAGTLLAGLLALAARPWALLASGLLLVTAGLLGLLVADLGWVPPALGLAAFGHGLVRAALWGAAARALGEGHEHLRTALFLVLYGATNLAGLLSGLAGRLASEGPAAPVFGLGAGLAAFALLLAAALSVVLLVSRARPVPPPPARAAHLVAVFGLALVLGSTWGSIQAVFDVVVDVAVTHSTVDHSALATLMSVNPAAVAGLTLLVAGLFAVLHFAKARLPVLLPAGVGLVVAALGASLVLVQGDEPSVPLLALAMVVVALGEVLAVPLALSRLTGSLPYRLETLVASLWLAALAAPGLVTRAFDDWMAAARVLAWCGVAGGLLWGVALAAAAFPLRRVFDRPGP